MKKKVKAKSSVPQVDPYIDGLMAKLLEHLVSIEKKLDSVLAQKQSGSAPSHEVRNNVSQPQAQPQRRDRTLYEAICADCSKVCEVPFKPSEDRAVYCKECFARRKSGGANHHNHHSQNRNKNFPVLTPVALPPKPASRMVVPQTANTSAPATSFKAKKGKPAKNSKKRR